MELNNKDKRRLWTDLTLKRQIEYLKKIPFVLDIETAIGKFFFIFYFLFFFNSEEISRRGNLTIMAGADRFP